MYKKNNGSEDVHENARWESIWLCIKIKILACILK